MEPATAQELLRYNTWANIRVVDRAAALGAANFTRTLGGSYPSVQAALTHILWAEWLWLERWQGRSPQLVFAPEEYPSVAALTARWSEIQSSQAVFASSLTSDKLAEVVRYTNLKGEVWAYPLWRMLYHLCNHSSYHRGQVANMLRLLGVQPAPTDFLVFRDEGG